jgi:hypothetical protein
MQRQWMHNVSNATDVISIYASTKDDMLLFLKQHNFDMRYVNIEYVDDNRKILDSYVLKTYHFRSNKSNEVFHIKTCESFVASAIATVGDHLSDTCIFGESIFRDDIEFIKVVTDLIDKLPFATVVDWSLLDGDSCNMMGYDNLSWMVVKKDLLFSENYEPDFEHMDTSSIYDDLSQASDPDRIQPITIEAYVRGFAESIISIK